jgi:hypothetical protein
MDLVEQGFSYNNAQDQPDSDQDQCLGEEYEVILPTAALSLSSAALSWPSAALSVPTAALSCQLPPYHAN